MEWDKWKAKDAWSDLACDVGSFESIAKEMSDGIECNLTESQWNDIRMDLDKGIEQYADDLLANIIYDYLKGHYSEK